jgi:UDP-glucose 4-epimerase
VLTRSRPDREVLALLDESRLHIGDAADPEVVERALDGIDHVAFCAGGLLPSASESNPDLDRRLTLKPVQAVLEALAERPGVTLTYLSSGGTVYGEPRRLPVQETDPTEPVSSYGELHLACEQEIERARGAGGLKARILRCSTVYGEYQRPDRGQGVIVTFLHRIERGEPIDIFGGGTTIRDYVYAGDVARAMVGLIGTEAGPSVVNVGSGGGTSLLEVLKMAEREAGKPAQVVQHEERGFDVHQIVLDTARLHELVELEITPLQVGIERTHRWLTTKSPEPA